MFVISAFPLSSEEGSHCCHHHRIQNMIVIEVGCDIAMKAKIDGYIIYFSLKEIG